MGPGLESKSPRSLVHCCNTSVQRAPVGWYLMAEETMEEW